MKRGEARWRFLRGLFPRVYRLCVLAAAAALLHWAAHTSEFSDGQVAVMEKPDLALVRRHLPGAKGFARGDAPRGGLTVLDARHATLGYVLSTSPWTDDLVGYAGPSDLLVVLDRERRVLGVEVLASADTQAHVSQVIRAESFWAALRGWNVDREPPPRVDAVSGSTLTSLAMAEAVERRLRGEARSLRFPDEVTVAEAREMFPEATMLARDVPRPGWYEVRDPRGDRLGYVVRTSPHSDNGRGYRGPTESLVGVEVDGRVVRDVRLRSSYDTAEYVERVRSDEGFRRLLRGRTVEEWARIDFAREGIEGVSGATQTSFAVADGVRRRFSAEWDRGEGSELEKGWRGFGGGATAGGRSARATYSSLLGMLAVIIVGSTLTWTALRTNRRLRLAWQAALVVIFSLWLGDLVSLGLLVGWSKQGMGDLPWRSAPSLVLVVVVALLVPWTTGRQLYCQQICPHGAAQSWLGRFSRLHVRVPAKWNRWLARVPAILLIGGLGVALSSIRFELAWLEPFDGWVLRGAAMVSLMVAAAGLLVSVFVPQAYCRYGCPTGELLRFVKGAGRGESWGRRDVVAGLVVFVAVLWVVGVTARHREVLDLGVDEPPSRGERVVNADRATVASPARIGGGREGVKVDEGTSDKPPLHFSGEAFGTTWRVTVRGGNGIEEVRRRVSEELERVERGLSHWSADSETTLFNESETTLEVEVSEELLDRVELAMSLSRATDGAYDITVGPLVDLWGYGPKGLRATKPGEEEVRECLEYVGWKKLHVDRLARTMRKERSRLQLDLGSLLQGYAADRVAALLDELQQREFLVEVGGEILVRGEWTIAIERPGDTGGVLRTLRLRDVGLATSGTYRSGRKTDGEWVHHIISPRLGRPVSTTASLCAVVARTAEEADALATALLGLNEREAMELAEEREVGVLWMGLDGRVVTNAKLESFVTREKVSGETPVSER